MREYSQQNALAQNSTSNNINMVSPPQIGILQAINNRLDDIIDQTQRISNRQHNFVERIFGAIPCEAGQGKATSEPSGLADAANRRLENLITILEEISQEMTRIERLA